MKISEKMANQSSLTPLTRCRDKQTTGSDCLGILIDWKGAILLALASLITLSSCSEPPPYIPPKAGEVVTWKHSSELIIKTKLGQRREHVPDKLDDLIYEPEYEQYVGQFPVDYVPKRFPKMTQPELDAFLTEYDSKLHAVKSQHPIQFSLMLNGAKGKATDESIHSPNALDDVNQVKVEIDSYKVTSNTQDGHNRFLKSKEGRYDKQSSDEYGLDCHYQTRVSSLGCFGKSESPDISGVLISISSDGWVRGQSWELIYGGIHVEWRIHRSNLKSWKKVDAAIWRLLESWNVSPLNTQIEN